MPEAKFAEKRCAPRTHAVGGSAVCGSVTDNGFFLRNLLRTPSQFSWLTQTVARAIGCGLTVASPLCVCDAAAGVTNGDVARTRYSDAALVDMVSKVKALAHHTSRVKSGVTVAQKENVGDLVAYPSTLDCAVTVRRRLCSPCE